MDPIDYLFGLELHGIKLGLNTIRDLLHSMGNPQNSYPTIHVGGTNGKGSTVAFLDHILRASSYTVGRFTSPHLCSVNERFMIDGQPIADAELCSLIESVRVHTEQHDHSPTFFEMNTAIAFEYFKRHQVDIALIEVGMGGRFDSTNVITPLVSVITSIALEHTQFLGDTLEKIAYEKAGIIKPEIPLIMGLLPPSAAEVITQAAEAHRSPITRLDTDIRYQYAAQKNSIDYTGNTWTLSECPLPLAGMHQAENAALALATAELIAPTFPNLTVDSAKQGIINTRWPCRMEQVLSENPTVIVDVAHNPSGAQTLVNTLDRDTIVILSVSTDKDAEAMVQTLSTRANHLILTQFDGHRAAPAEDLLPYIPEGLPHSLIPEFTQAIYSGIHMARIKNIPLLITGSIFTAGQARAYLISDYDAPELTF